MIIGIDIGNTDTAAAVINDGTPVCEVRYKTAKFADADYHKAHLLTLTEKYSPEGVIISSVAPETNGEIAKACSLYLNKTPLFVSSALKTGLSFKRENPEKIGADIIAGAVGAFKKYGAPVIVVDIGTATTFCAVDKGGEYLGGVIAPGPYISMKALADAASMLSEIKLTPPQSVIGTNTEERMRIGVLTAHAAMIDGMLERIKKEMGASSVKAVATGGMSQDIAEMCEKDILCDRNLLMYGLYELYKMN